METITARIDQITAIPERMRAAVIGPPRSCKIEITADCNYKCLSGDSVVDTIYGKIPIRELAETMKSVPVFTYASGKVSISEAVNIRQVGFDRLVKVNFTDGSSLSCTPDHELLQFRVKGAAGTDEFRTQAQNLRKGDRVRAYRENKTGAGYTAICWGREFRMKRYRMVMEYLIGRELASGEVIHHKDHDISNDTPENLELCESMKDHFSKHPEFSERMRNSNPAKNMTQEWRDKLTASITGKTRSAEQKMRYRESKLGELNPNYKDGATAGRASRIAEVNHVVESVVEMDGIHPVYCLEVPETGWFFSNNVLVKNCQFCVKSLRDDNGMMDRALYSRLIRELRAAGVEELGVFYIGESFTCKWLGEAIAEAKEVGFPYVFLTTNGSACTPKRLREVFDAGLDSLKFSMNFADAQQMAEVTQVSGKLYSKAIANLKMARKIRDEGGYKCRLYASSIAFDGEQGEKMKALIEEIKPFVDEAYWLPLYGMSGAAKEYGWKPRPGNPGRLDAMRDPLPCWAVFTEAHITADGGLAACCFGSGLDGDLKMADLTKVSFMDGWNSPEFQALRSAHLAMDVSKTACRDCAAG